MIIFDFDTKMKSDKFNVIYEKYGKTVYYTIKRFVSDEYIIEDLSQEVYLRILGNLSKIDMNNGRRTKNFIITIARNLCKNYLRNQEKVKELPLEELFNSSDSNDFLDQIITQEQIHLLAKEISRLKDDYKSVLELKYVNQFCDNEIADSLKIEKKTVEMRLYRAKIILRKKLKEK